MNDYKEIGYLQHEYPNRTIGVKVLINSPIEIDKNYAIRVMIDKFQEELIEQINLEIVTQNPENGRIYNETIFNLQDCFPQKYNYHVIPNEYCSKYCCYTKPWLRVHTPIGPIKIGWRKRVINIDWSEVSPLYLISPTVFKDENVTCGEYYVHAWGYDKAKEYIFKILNGWENF